MNMINTAAPRSVETSTPAYKYAAGDRVLFWAGPVGLLGGEVRWHVPIGLDGERTYLIQSRYFANADGSARGGEFNGALWQIDEREIQA